MNKILISGLGLLTSLSGFAQQSLDESIAVDGRYAAEVIRMDRIAAFPAEYIIEVPREVLPYDLNPLASRFAPYAYPLPLPLREETQRRGYLDAALGSRLDAALHAGGWILPPSSPFSLGAWISHESTSLGRLSLDHHKFPKRFDYNEGIGLVASHKLDNNQLIRGRADYGLRYFNYFMAPEPITQTINRFKIGLDWSSAPGADLTHSLGLDVSYFGYRDMKLPGFAELPWSPSRQTVTRLSGFIEGVVNERGAGNMKDKMSLMADIYGVFGSNPGNYALGSFTPSYNIAAKGVNMNLGLRLDLAAKAGSSSDPFSAIHLAPAVNIWFPTDHFTFYAKAGGGSEIQTLEKRGELSRWVSPCQFSHTPVFSPIDASIGFNGGPAQESLRGLKGGLQIRYKAVSHLPLLGWYPLSLMAGEDAGAELLALNQGSMSLHGFEFSGSLGWSFGKVADLDLNLSYSPQSNTKGFFNGIDRARWIGKGSLDLTPIDPLHIRISSLWRGVRYVYGYMPEFEGVRLRDWFALNLEADWKFTGSLSLGLGAYNLTGRKNIELPGVPAEGLAVAGRLSWNF